MPDDDRRFSEPNPIPDRIDLAATKTDSNSPLEQVSRLHKQLPRSSSARTL